MTLSQFEARASSVLQNVDLQHSYRDAMDYLVERRQQQFNDPDEWYTLRKIGSSIKTKALSRLPELLLQLEATLNNNGIQVHWAETPDEANQIILQLIKETTASTPPDAHAPVVKGKTMVSEEIHLNQFLTQQGIPCLETDMGEFIVQLANETPSHIIMPAIHKSKADIAQLFKSHVSGQYQDDVDTLIQQARQHLRQRFQKATVGISGVNFAVAETGTIVLVENEGNGRMCTTLPQTHIALMGIEKVIASLTELPPLLSLLTRSATGQSITTYINMISGPRSAEEKDGPEQVHVILLDNGRSRLWEDPTFRDVLRCIRCGACMNHCPVYARVGGHTYGTTYPGPIGKILAPQLETQSSASELPFASSLCGACGEVCPVKIPIPQLLLRWRQEATGQYRSYHGSHFSATHNQPTPITGQRYSRWEHLIWKTWSWLNCHPMLYHFMTYLVTKCRVLLPRRLSGWTSYRASLVPASNTLHQRLKTHQRHTTSSKKQA
ncbi:LutB/LldF family L-lactate oxidation iron-sulfur protein [Zooshikella harenae]|uniref:Iron-sulfur cluster-binding protein n=1 Tax=Zooshikella harenae TaxID=2827238 RepID=A0ABS5ZG49_9GAMM|nr:LutB/LldF family L-lactate oxidation iron-sulfur protein [Zooshikella harenae]MBU2713047.1 iron-sulfur cluster-binding protein [Zooshikella harenae]